MSPRQEMGEPEQQQWQRGEEEWKDPRRGGIGQSSSRHYWNAEAGFL